MDVYQNIAIISASLGGFDRPQQSVKQSLEHDYFLFTDENFPPRDKALTPRLQAKIPKMFGWQLKPGYDYYLWLDGNLSLAQADSLQYFYDQCQGQDMVVLRHHRRPNIRQEARYLRKGLREQSDYLAARYGQEWTPEQVAEIAADKSYVDDLLVIGGVFMYKNTPAVQQMFRDWWYFTTRYSVFDQLAFAYVLKKNNLRIKILEVDWRNCPHLTVNGHTYHAK